MNYRIDNLQYCNWSRDIFLINREAGLNAVHVTLVYHEDYDEFLQRVKETNEAQNLQVSKLKILESPNLPGSHFYPNPKKNSIIAFIVAFISAFVLLVFKEMSSFKPIAIKTINNLT